MKNKIKNSSISDPISDYLDNLVEDGWIKPEEVLDEKSELPDIGE